MLGGRPRPRGAQRIHSRMVSLGMGNYFMIEKDKAIDVDWHETDLSDEPSSAPTASLR